MSNLPYVYNLKSKPRNGLPEYLISRKDWCFLKEERQPFRQILQNS